MLYKTMCISDRSVTTSRTHKDLKTQSSKTRLQIHPQCPEFAADLFRELIASTVVAFGFWCLGFRVFRFWEKGLWLSAMKMPNPQKSATALIGGFRK